MLAGHDSRERELAIRSEIAVRVVDEERVTGALHGVNPVESRRCTGSCHRRSRPTYGGAHRASPIIDYVLRHARTLLSVRTGCSGLTRLCRGQRGTLLSHTLVPESDGAVIRWQ